MACLYIVFNTIKVSINNIHYIKTKLITIYKGFNNYDKMPPFILKFFQNIQYDLSYNKNKENKNYDRVKNDKFYAEDF